MFPNRWRDAWKQNNIQTEWKLIYEMLHTSLVSYSLFQESRGAKRELSHWKSSQKLQNKPEARRSKEYFSRSMQSTPRQENVLKLHNFAAALWRKYATKTICSFVRQGGVWAEVEADKCRKGECFGGRNDKWPIERSVVDEIWKQMENQERKETTRRKK